MLEDGRPLSRAPLMNWLRQILTATGIQGNFSSHSFRRGAGTTGARSGVSGHLIKALG